MTERPEPVPDVADPGRLAALEGYAILDTPPEPGFDGIVVLARALCAMNRRGVLDADCERQQ